jgi:hypothetical protein
VFFHLLQLVILQILLFFGAGFYFDGALEPAKEGENQGLKKR